MEIAKALIESYPGLFWEKAAISLPRGWLEFVRRVLDAYRDMGPVGQIRRIYFTREFEARVSLNGPMPYQELLNRLLAPASRICMNCGRDLLPEEPPSFLMWEKDAPEDDVDEFDWSSFKEKPSRGRLPVCNACLAKAVL